MRPLKYSLFGGFELLNFYVEKTPVEINAKTYTPNHQKKKRGKFKRSGRK